MACQLLLFQIKGDSCNTSLWTDPTKQCMSQLTSLQDTVGKWRQFRSSLCNSVLCWQKWASILSLVCPIVFCVIFGCFPKRKKNLRGSRFENTEKKEGGCDKGPGHHHFGWLPMTKWLERYIEVRLSDFEWD